MKLLSKKEALLAKFKHYYTGVPCKNGHDCVRYTKDGGCFECRKKGCEKTRTQNPKRYASYIRKWEQNHPEQHRKMRQLYWELNKERLAPYNRLKSAQVRALKMNATPKWLTPSQHNQIRAIYKEAARLTKETKIVYHVDHIEPLQGKQSCGLHVPWNLQILTAKENLKKSNKPPILV